MKTMTLPQSQGLQQHEATTGQRAGSGDEGGTAVCRGSGGDTNQKDDSKLLYSLSNVILYATAAEGAAHAVPSLAY